MITIPAEVEAKPIEILLTRNEDFLKIARIVDRDEILAEILDLRRNLNLKKYLTDIELVDVLIGVIYGDEKSRSNHLNKINKLKVKMKLKEAQKIAPYFSYFQAVNYLIDKYKLGFSYYELLFQVLLCNKVFGYVYSEQFWMPINWTPPSWETSFKDMMKSFLAEVNNKTNPKAAIVIDADTKQLDLIQMFKEIKKVFPKQPKDIITNIKRDRNWYWLHKNNWSYSRIQQEEQKSGKIYSRDAVIKAINRYKHLINTDI